MAITISLYWDRGLPVIGSMAWLLVPVMPSSIGPISVPSKYDGSLRVFLTNLEMPENSFCTRMKRNRINPP